MVVECNHYSDDSIPHQALGNVAPVYVDCQVVLCDILILVEWQVSHGPLCNHIDCLQEAEMIWDKALGVAFENHFAPKM